MTPDRTPQEEKDPFRDLFADSVESDLTTFLSSTYSDLPTRPVYEDSSDDSYFNFFLSELSKAFPYVYLFPWTAATLFSTSNHNPALRHAVLAVAALIADPEEAHTEALNHLTIAIQGLRNRLSSADATEAEAIICFLLAHFSIAVGDPASARKHLDGMYGLLKKISSADAFPNPAVTDKLTVLIWRMAIRVDYISSIACGEAPILPRYSLHYFTYSSVDEKEGVHHEWIRSHVDTIPDNADWAEAWFALDGLLHRTCHAAHTVNALRATPGSASERQIHRLLDDLTRAHHQWRERQVVRKGDDREQLNELMSKVPFDRDGTSPANGDTTSFLDYSPVRIFNPFLASRLNNWRAIRLYIRLIEEPMWGLYDGSRFVCAVDLCRTYAALGAERDFLGAEKSVGLYLAGVVFGGPSMYAVHPSSTKLT